MIAAVMRHCKCFNKYIVSAEKGAFEIQNSFVAAEGSYKKGQYIRVSGSYLNDNIYKVKSVADNEIEIDAVDEQFKGVIFSLKIPQDFLEIIAEIERYAELAEKDPEKANIISETYRGYTWTSATNASGVTPRWQDVFVKSLTPYRRMFDRYPQNIKAV